MSLLKRQKSLDFANKIQLYPSLIALTKKIGIKNLCYVSRWRTLTPVIVSVVLNSTYSYTWMKFTRRNSDLASNISISIILCNDTIKIDMSCLFSRKLQTLQFVGDFLKSNTYFLQNSLPWMEANHLSLIMYILKIKSDISIFHWIEGFIFQGKIYKIKCLIIINWQRHSIFDHSAKFRILKNCCIHIKAGWPFLFICLCI